MLWYHALIKQKFLIGNHAPFITKELSKAIRSKLGTKHKYLTWHSREKFLAFKKTKNNYNSVNKKVRKQYLEEATEDGDFSYKNFWNALKPL